MSSVHETRLAVPVNKNDHIRGPADAQLTLVEYGDYECRHCGSAHLVVQAIREDLGDHLRFVYRHFLLPRVNPHAQLAIEAAEAAGVQGKFWEMHDMLFANQNALDEPHLETYAAAVGLDLGTFRHNLSTRVHAARGRKDILSGMRSGVSVTPTLFINDVRYTGPCEFDPLMEALVGYSRKARSSSGE